jgi:hypothetical protein
MPHFPLKEVGYPTLDLRSFDDMTAGLMNHGTVWHTRSYRIGTSGNPDY